MKLKYYLRGIGIGIIVTALIFMIGASTLDQMSDEEIIARAKDLGLVEKTVLKEPESESVKQQNNTEDVPSASDSEPPSEELEAESTESETEESGDEISESLSENEISEVESEEVIEEFVVITIKSGDSSVSVSQKVFEAGLVENALEFDRFLCANGYDRKLTVGQHEIKAGATMQEIAEALSSR